MSTRTYIGKADIKTATWTGVYVHGDGNPASVLPTLGAFLARTGDVEGVMGLLTTGGATHWQSIDDEQIDPADYLPLDPAWAKAPFRTNERRAWNWFEYSEGRGLIAHGGVGVTFPAPEGIEAPSGTLHEGRTESENAPADAEWAYIFAGGDLVILRPKAFMEESTMLEVDRVPLADLATLSPERISAINYGPDFDRINPYAWSVDESVPTESRNLTAREWFGIDPLTPDDAIGIRYSTGVSYRFTGYSTADGKTRTVGAESEDGRKVDIKLRTVDWKLKCAPKGAEFVFPKTKFDLVTA